MGSTRGGTALGAGEEVALESENIGRTQTETRFELTDLAAEDAVEVDAEDRGGAAIAEADEDAGPSAAADGNEDQKSLTLTPSQALVEIIRLLAQSPQHKYMFLAELEWTIIPPVRLGQFRLFHEEGRVVGFVTWALVNEAVEKRLKREGKRLKPDEWKCGGRRVVMDVVDGLSRMRD